MEGDCRKIRKWKENKKDWERFRECMKEVWKNKGEKKRGIKISRYSDCIYCRVEESRRYNRRWSKN